MKITPSLSRILIKLDETEIEKQAKAAGLALPEKRNDRANTGTVIFVGPGQWQNGIQIPISIKEGDTVIFLRDFAVPTKIGEELFHTIEEKDVLVTITDEPLC